MIFRFLKKKKPNKKNIDIASESDLFIIKIKKPISYITQIQVLYQGTSFIHVNLLAGAFFSRFCDQYFLKFPIWNSRADEKRREIRMVKVNVIFNDIRLLICLTPLQVNWVMVIN